MFLKLRVSVSSKYRNHPKLKISAPKRPINVPNKFHAPQHSKWPLRDECRGKTFFSIQNMRPAFNIHVFRVDSNLLKNQERRLLLIRINFTVKDNNIRPFFISFE